MVSLKIRCRHLRVNAIHILRSEFEVILFLLIYMTEQNQIVDGFFDTVPGLDSSTGSLGGFLSRPKVRTPIQQTTSKTITTTLRVCVSMSLRP